MTFEECLTKIGIWNTYPYRAMILFLYDHCVIRVHDLLTSEFFTVGE